MDVSAVSSHTSSTPVSTTDSETGTGETGFAALLQGAFPRLSMTSRTNATLEKAMTGSSPAMASSRMANSDNHISQTQTSSSWASSSASGSRASRGVQTNTAPTSSDRTTSPSGTDKNTSSTGSGTETAPPTGDALSDPIAPVRSETASKDLDNDTAVPHPDSEGETASSADALLNDAIALAPATPAAEKPVSAAPLAQGQTSDGIKPVQENAPATPAQPEATPLEANDDSAAQLQKQLDSAQKAATSESAPTAGTSQAAAAGTAAVRTESASNSAANTLPAQSATDLAPAAAVSGSEQATTDGNTGSDAGKGDQSQPQTQASSTPDIGRIALAASQPVQTIAEPPTSSVSGTQTQTIQALSATQGTAAIGLAASGRLDAATATTTLASAARMNPMDQIRVQIGKSLAGGMDSIHVRLHPESMGQVDIKLELKGGQVTAAVTADKPETLQLLKNDAASLQQALKDAGLDADSSSLSFHLRSQQQDARTAQGNDDGTILSDDESDEPIEAAISTLTDETADGLDIRV